MLEFVAVGHVAVDHGSGATRLGGAAAYAAVTASRLGLSAGIVTCAGADFPFWHELEGIEVDVEECEETTEFENLYVDERRRQRVLALAAPLNGSRLETLRPRLREDAVVLYCPVVHEIEVPLVAPAPRGLCGVAPQGFFRRWDRDGLVSGREWSGAEAALEHVDLVVLSEADHEAPEALAEDFAVRAGRTFVVTRGAEGSRVYSGVDVYQLPAFPATVVDPTGAGDVFAAAMLVALREGRPVPWAASFAAAAAAFAVEGPGLTSIPRRAEVEQRLSRSHE